MEQHYNARLVQEAPARPTEGMVTAANKSAKANATLAARRRGRPRGSRNKPKALIPKEIATEFLGVVRELLPEEYYKEMRDAIRTGKNISTLNEAKILMKLMGPPIWKRLIDEASGRGAEEEEVFDPDLAAEIGAVSSGKSKAFDKDLDERIKVYINLMTFVDKLEKQSDEGANSKEEPILKVFARRGIDAARIDFVANPELRLVGGDIDGTGRGSAEIRAIPSQVPERQINIQDNVQGEATWDINDGRVGNDALSGDETQL